MNQTQDMYICILHYFGLSLTVTINL